jgi:hypothetical protein
MTKDEIAQATTFLRSLLKPGTTVYTKINHVTRSGMSRSITAYAIIDDKPVYLSGYAARVLDERRDKYDGITLAGCGMDMGFELVYRLSRKLYPEGYTCVGQHCPSNDHSNGDRNYGRHHHCDGGYALRQRWL